jgi:hypothetical protein
LLGRPEVWCGASTILDRQHQLVSGLSRLCLPPVAASTSLHLVLSVFCKIAGESLWLLPNAIWIPWLHFLIKWGWGALAPLFF